LIKAQMHPYLGRRPSRPRNSLSGRRNDHQIGLVKIDFGRTCRRDQDVPVGEPGGHIALLSRDQSALIQPAANTNDFAAHRLVVCAADHSLNRWMTRPSTIVKW